MELGIGELDKKHPVNTYFVFDLRYFMVNLETVSALRLGDH